VPGLDVAARFRAAGEGNEVGGDFYDVFDTGGSRWAAVIGDVCGKGADAAAVTALARYTLRTAAMRERWPSEVLSTLNEAMLRQRNDEQFCTVAFGVIQPGEDGVQVVLASGGHPLPLLLRADGRVETVGHPGTLLGVVKDPQLSDQAVHLHPGDALVFYTDGVTEAQAPQRIISTAELAAKLGECRNCDSATLAERLEGHAVPAGREPRDDVAILVLRLREPA
jgi:serine phosphatase RsbU (regulator of sigma subunit)